MDLLVKKCLTKINRDNKRFMITKAQFEINEKVSAKKQQKAAPQNKYQVIT